jgi:hypothetical protein
MSSDNKSNVTPSKSNKDDLINKAVQSAPAEPTMADIPDILIFLVKESEKARKFISWRPLIDFMVATYAFKAQDVADEIDMLVQDRRLFWNGERGSGNARKGLSAQLRTTPRSKANSPVAIGGPATATSKVVSKTTEATARLAQMLRDRGMKQGT